MNARAGGESAADDALLRLLADRYGIAALDTHAGAIYVVDADWRLCYTNPAWSRFAADNGAGPLIHRRFPRGSSLLDAFNCDELRAFYVAHYTLCRTSGRLWRHEYDCSSPEIYRRFQQLVYPLPGDHLLVVNSRLVECPLTMVVHADSDPLCVYRDAHGLIHQCAHCRRVCAANDDRCWDWVPEWAREIPLSASHTFCPTCAGFYYPPPGRR